MRDELYTIEVSDGMVLIYGDLTMREAFDFLAFFDQQGYKSVVSGHENSTLCLMKEDCREVTKEILENLKKEKESAFEAAYKKEKDNTEILIKKLKATDQILKDLLSDEKKREEILKREDIKNKAIDALRFYTIKEYGDENEKL